MRNKITTETAAAMRNVMILGLVTQSLLVAKILKPKRKWLLGRLISDYARTTVVISWWALLFLFLSLVAASIAAYYAKRTANAAERSDGAFVDIELSTNPEKFFEMDLKNDPNMTISILISNYGNTPARKLRYKITPVYNCLFIHI